MLVARDGLTLGELPAGARIGTGSPRRTAQLLGARPGPRRRPDPRQRRHPHRQGALRRARRRRARPRRAWPGSAGSTRSTEVIDPLQVLPAPAQGALAIECRADDAELVALLAALDDADTRAAVDAERALLAALEAGCTAPVGALAEVAEGDDGLEIFLRGLVAARRRDRRGPPLGDRTDVRGSGGGTPARRRAARPRRRGPDGSTHMTKPTRPARKPPRPGRTGGPRRRRHRRPGAARRARRRAARAPPTSSSPTSAAPTALLAGVARRRRGRPHARPASAQGAALVAAAKDGRAVVRLLPGDPFLHAEGAKEAEAVLKAKQRLEVVPGRARRRRRARLRRRRRRPAPHRRPRRRRHRLARRSPPRPARWSCSRSAARGRQGAPPRSSSTAARPATPVSVTVGGTTTEQRTVVVDPRRRRARPCADLRGDAVVVVGDPVKKAEQAVAGSRAAPLYGWRVLVPRTRDQAGALSALLRALRRRPGRGADHRGRAAAHPRADGARGQGPARRPLRLGRVHLHQRRQGRAREARGVRPRRARASRRQGRRGRRGHRAGARRLRHPARPRARAASSPARACSPTGRRTTTSSTRSTACFLPRADIATDTLRRRPEGARLAGRRRHRLPHRARRAAARRDPRGAQGRRLRRRAVHLVARPCATSSASPASRTTRRCWRASARRPRRPPRSSGLRVDVLSPQARRRLARRGARGVRARAPRGALPASRRCRARPTAARSPGWRRSGPGDEPAGLPRGPAAPAAPHPRAAPARRRRAACAPADLVLPVFVKEGIAEPRADRARCRASCSTPATRCKKAAARGGRRPASAG